MIALAPARHRPALSLSPRLRAALPVLLRGLGWLSLGLGLGAITDLMVRLVA